MKRRRRLPRYLRESTAAEPPGPVPVRIPADTSQQAPHTSWGGVPLHYEDKEFICVDCGKTEIWTAQQQKWWYETAKGYILSTAIRCNDCRQKLRDSHGGTPRRSHQERRDSGR
ncbi:MAG: zinc-ribbon domain-containing protein [Planctomycetaceae bacterium]|nr:zinc-ribbon domain-containing protein [Planctomycetaceae bacterium]